MDEKYYRLWRLFMEKIAVKAEQSEGIVFEKECLLQMLVLMVKLEGEAVLEE